jgi:hypothetical protein
MKANKAPEKIILSADRETGILYNEWVVNDLTDNIKIEYIRKNTFINKAIKWISNNCYIPHATLEDFRKYMEGE